MPSCNRASAHASLISESAGGGGDLICWIARLHVDNASCYQCAFLEFACEHLEHEQPPNTINAERRCANVSSLARGHLHGLQARKSQLITHNLAVHLHVAYIDYWFAAASWAMVNLISERLDLLEWNLRAHPADDKLAHPPHNAQNLNGTFISALRNSGACKRDMRVATLVGWFILRLLISKFACRI